MSTRKREIKVSRKYSFWRHPIKYFKDRKKIAFLEMYLNNQWENGLREEVDKVNRDILFYGGAFMKDGKRVCPTELTSKGD